MKAPFYQWIAAILGLAVAWALGYRSGKRMAATLLEQEGIDRKKIDRALGWWKP